MSLPTLSGTARLTADPELRFAPSGVAVAKMNLAFNARRKNESTGQWEDGDTFFVEAVAFKQLAENIAESFIRGMEVVVTGRLKTDQWNDKQTGEKRSKPSLLIDSIGPSIAFATAKVQKMDRSNSSGQTRRQQPADDPWATATPAGNSSSSGFDDEPPF
jgi:single-strand DNA-binding protein